jgi:hypothetical protein
VLPALLLLPSLLAAACAGRNPGAPPAELGRVLTAEPDTVWIRPGGTGAVTFALRTLEGTPVPDAAVTFAIVDDPTNPGVMAQGATLASASGVTDGMGMVDAQVMAGLLTTFRMRASADGAEADAVIVVAPDVVGSVDVAPFFPPGSRAAPLATTVEVLFFENSACVDISLRQPPTPVRPPRELAPEDGVARFDFVTTAFSHAVVGRAKDGHGALLALGCSDLPGRTLIAGGTVQIALPLPDASPDPVGSFAVTSEVAFAPPLAAAAALAAPWVDLGDCPLDPAQLWLDTTIDALGGAAPSDTLAARRGAFLVGPDGTPTACRGARDESGAVSVDAAVLGLFGSPLPQPVVDLGAIGDEATHLLDAITVRSQLDLRPSTSAALYQATHTLLDVVFGGADARKEVQLAALGLPALSADTTASVQDGALVVGAHGLTLRLGSAARVAFGTLGLAQRGLPQDAAGFLGALTALARSADGTRTGCAALDATLCAEASHPAGCLGDACTTGLAALAARLDGAFDAADGAGLDFYLAGSAPLFDRHGNGTADRIGDSQSTPPAPGTWTVDLHTGAGHASAAGTWDAVRTGN